MAKLIIAVLIILSSMLIADAASSIAKDPKSVSNWFKRLSSKKEKITNLHFYFHDTVSGENPTAVMVARANNNDSSPLPFGLVNVIDDVLTSGQNLNSTVVGRAQGLYAQAAVTGNPALLFTVNFVFTSGKYNGSTLSVLGQNPILDEYREMPIVGGTGVFRLARGLATAHNVFVNLATRDAIVEFHVVAIHY